jgi:hypothetical protein
MFYGFNWRFLKKEQSMSIVPWKKVQLSIRFNVSKRWAAPHVSLVCLGRLDVMTSASVEKGGTQAGVSEKGGPEAMQSVRASTMGARFGTWWELVPLDLVRFDCGTWIKGYSCHILSPMVWEKLTWDHASTAGQAQAPPSPAAPPSTVTMSSCCSSSSILYILADERRYLNDLGFSIPYSSSSTCSPWWSSQLAIKVSSSLLSSLPHSIQENMNLGEGCFPHSWFNPDACPRRISYMLCPHSFFSPSWRILYMLAHIQLNMPIDACLHSLGLSLLKILY